MLKVVRIYRFDVSAVHASSPMQWLECTLIEAGGDGMRVGSVGLGGYAGTRRAMHYKVEIGIDSVVTYLIFEGGGTKVAER